METFKKLCRDMAANPEVMTFSDLGRAAAKGVVLGQKFDQPVIGAILSVSLEASKRAVHMSENLINEISTYRSETENTAPSEDEDLDRAKSQQPKLRS